MFLKVGQIFRKRGISMEASTTICWGVSFLSKLNLNSTYMKPET